MLILEIEQKNRKLITEQWNDPRWMLIEQKHIVPFVTSLEKYITEAELTPDQIKSLFTSVEKQATDSGSNRTLAGKGVDATKWINNKINELGASLAKSGPVTNLDQKVEDLKRKIGAKDTKTVQIIKSISDWAKDNPKKASVAVGILTAAAAMAGGPLGGAVAGFLARATKDLLQGSKLSSAVGKSVKTAVVGFLAGNVFKFLSDEMKDFFTSSTEADLKAASDALVNAKVQNLTQAVEAKYGEAADLWNEAFPDGNYKVNVNVSGTGGSYFSGDVILTKAQALEYNQLLKTANEFRGTDIFSEQGRQAMAKTYAFLEQVKATTDQSALAMINAQGIEALNAIRAAGEAALEDPELKSQIAKLSGDAAKDIAIMKDITDLAAAAGQGAVQARPDKGKSVTESIHLSEIQVALLTEGIMDNIKGAASKVANKAKSAAAGVMRKGVGAAQQVGKNITTKVTADKLLSAWKKAGSPTDSDKVYQVLRTAGISDEVMEPVFKSMSIPFIKGAPRNVQPAPTDTGPSAMAMRTPKSNQTPGAQQQPQAAAPAQAQQQPQAAAPTTAPGAQQQPQAAASAPAQAQAPAQQQPQATASAQAQTQAKAPAQAQSPTQTETMDQYIVRWFDAYMQGVNWKEYEPKVTEFAKEIANSYEKDKGKSGIQQLANIAWEVTSKGSEIPSGARNVPNMYSTPAAGGGKLSDKELAKRIKDDTEKLNKTDPNLYKQIKNSLPESSKLRRKYHD
jgi:hypothetical protein